MVEIEGGGGNMGTKNEKDPPIMEMEFCRC